MLLAQTSLRTNPQPDRRLVGSRYWVVDEGLFVDALDRLVPVARGADIAPKWKKGAGPTLRITQAGAAPQFLFLPGLALKLGETLTLFGVQIGENLEQVERALKQRRLSAK